MGKRFNQTDLYIDKSADFAKPILEHIRVLSHATCPDIEEKLNVEFRILSMKAFQKFSHSMNMRIN